MLLARRSQMAGFRFLAYLLMHLLVVSGIVLPAQAAAPLANAGGDRVLEQSHLGGGTLQLDGSGSFDPDGDPLNYQWSAPSAAPVAVPPWSPSPPAHIASRWWSMTASMPPATPR